MSKTCTSNPFYVVISIPTGATDISNYQKCKTGGNPCKSLEFYIGGGNCTPVAYDVNGQSCNTSKNSGGNNTAFSIYQYMGGDPASVNPITAGNQLIPCIGGNFPINYTGPSKASGTYVDIIVGGNVPAGGGSNPGRAGLLVVYDTCWITSFADLAELDPNNKKYNFLNTLTNYQNGSIQFFFTDTVTPIPTLESQISQVLATFCSIPGTICTGGKSFCSNFFSDIPLQTGTINYCYQAYQDYLNNKSYYTQDPNNKFNTDTRASVATAMTAYCGQFHENSPTECQCLNRGQISLYHEISAEGGDASPISCWWYPCKDSANYLIGYDDYKSLSGGCPSVCQEIFKIMGGSHINSNNSQVNQYMVCCQGNSGSGNSCCNDPTQSACQKCNGNNCGDTRTFFQKYGIFIIGIIVLILFLAIIIGIIIWSRRKK